MDGLLNNPLFWIVLILIVLLILLYLLWARAHGRSPFPRYPREEFYIQDQVLVTGPAGRVNAVLSGLDGIANEPIRSLAVGGLVPAGQTCPELPADLVVALYQLTGTEKNVQRAIQQIQDAAGGGVSADVIGEPNLLVGHPWDPEGSPWDPEGSPWDPEGSPWDPEGSPWNALLGLLGIHRKKTSAQAAQPEWFMQQWAWRAIGLPVATAAQPQPLPVSGQGVRVGVFDTSPYFPGLPEEQQANKHSLLAQVPADLNLHVQHPRLYAHPAPSTRASTDVSNHGYYVSGLVHALAPGADLRLIRVLEADARGDTFSLAAALYDFVVQARAEGVERRTLINLSLGIRIPPEDSGFMPARVLALRYMLQAAQCLGVTTLSASGNASAGKPAEPQDLPAGWPVALGIAAVNPREQRSCFSNRGEIAAPGGDGRSLSSANQAAGMAPTATQASAAARPSALAAYLAWLARLAVPAAKDGCHPRNADCTGPDSPWSVIGPVLDPAAEPAGYIFWSGTSFATPIVSGLAALVLEVGGGRFTPQQVEEILKCGAVKTGDANLGAGVINVPATLACCQKALRGLEQQPGRDARAG